MAASAEGNQSIFKETVPPQVLDQTLLANSYGFLALTGATLWFRVEERRILAGVID